MPSWNALNFQDMSSLTMLELISLHDYVMVVMLSILILILYIMTILLFSKFLYKTFSESTLIETIWSIVPAMILILLVLPSMKVLYMVEDIKNPQTTFKIVAHQWYWSFISPLFLNLFFLEKGNITKNFELDSTMETNSNLRLLNSSNSLVLPYKITTRLLLTSTDVIHSFSIPSLGLKVDAMPGRLNQLYTTPFRMGLYYGQCSEICGSNHSFMPISIQVCSNETFNKNMLSTSLNNL